MSNEIKTTSTQEIFLQPYTMKQIAQLYGVNYRTLRKWLKPFQNEIGKKVTRCYTIPQVRIIFEKLDYPTKAIINNATDK